MNQITQKPLLILASFRLIDFYDSCYLPLVVTATGKRPPLIAIIYMHCMELREIFRRVTKFERPKKGFLQS